jgi:hypothetical protein
MVKASKNNVLWAVAWLRRLRGILGSFPSQSRWTKQHCDRLSLKTSVLPLQVSFHELSIFIFLPLMI